MRLSADDRRLLLGVFLLTVTTRVGLGLLSYGRLRKLMTRFGGVALRSPPGTAYRIERILWAVDTVGGRILGDKPCLTEALVAQLLLNRNGLSTDLRIGVARGDQGDLKAHAWLEHQGQVLIGGKAVDLKQFAPFPPLPGQGRASKVTSGPARIAFHSLRAGREQKGAMGWDKQ